MQHCQRRRLGGGGGAEAQPLSPEDHSPTLTPQPTHRLCTNRVAHSPLKAPGVPTGALTAPLWHSPAPRLLWGVWVGEG